MVEYRYRFSTGLDPFKNSVYSDWLWSLIPGKCMSPQDSWKERRQTFHRFLIASRWPYGSGHDIYFCGEDDAIYFRLLSGIDPEEI